jgi:hypothetical protein
MSLKTPGPYSTTLVVERFVHQTIRAEVSVTHWRYGPRGISTVPVAGVVPVLPLVGADRFPAQSTDLIVYV